MDDGRPGKLIETSLLAQLPPDVVESFTPEQRAALWELSHAPSWQRYPVNIRLSLPFLAHRFFVTILAGADRRSGDRATVERHMNPFLSAPNLLFLAAMGTLLAAAVAVVLLVLQFLGQWMGGGGL